MKEGVINGTVLLTISEYKFMVIDDKIWIYKSLFAYRTHGKIAMKNQFFDLDYFPFFERKSNGKFFD